MKVLVFISIPMLLITCTPIKHPIYTPVEQPVPCNCQQIEHALVEADIYLKKNFNQEALLRALSTSNLDIPLDLSRAQYKEYTLLNTINREGQEQVLTWVKVIKQCTSFDLQPITIEETKGYVLENTKAWREAVEQKNCRAIKKAYH